MMKLLLIALGMLAVPAVTGWLETRDLEMLEIRRMADRDRKKQAVRLPARRKHYAACPCQRGRKGLPFEMKKDRRAVERQAVHAAGRISKTPRLTV